MTTPNTPMTDAEFDALHGGPAFPRDHRHDGHNGMTLRDYIAISAMNGALGGAPGPHLVPHTLARDSYAQADAMLKARKP